MAKVFDSIDTALREWIAKQHMYFVATAPLDGEGHVNVSPKGPIGTLRVLDDSTVAYLDLVGSGAETIAHLRENGRIVVMLCATEGPPRILRLHGRGEVITADDPRFESLMERCGRARRRHAHRGLVRVRRAADELRGPPPPHGEMGVEAASRGRPGRAARLPAREERAQPRRPSGGRAG
jgi:hypothetical protein